MLVNIWGYSIVPDHWINLYPITYYFLGAYIAEYSNIFKISFFKNIVLWLVIVFVSGTYSYARSYTTIFLWGTWNSWEGILNVLSTVSVFILLLKMDLTKWPHIILKIISKISEVSLQIYLVSWIFDTHIYNLLNNNVLLVRDRLFYFIPVVGVVFIGSFVLALLIDVIYKWIDKILCKKFISKI